MADDDKPSPAPADASILGSAAPALHGRMVGEPGSWMRKRFPDGIEINIGQGLFLGMGIAGLVTFLTLLGYAGAKLAPEETADFYAFLTTMYENRQPEEEPAGDLPIGEQMAVVAWRYMRKSWGF